MNDAFENLTLYQIPVSLDSSSILDHFSVPHTMADFNAIGQLHLWIGQPGIVSGLFTDYLDADELKRMQKFKLDTQKRDFSDAHSMLRLILSRYTDIPPQEIRFEYGINGKPAIIPEQNKKNVSFNLSHSNGYFACAVGYQNGIGLDLEHVTPINQQVNSISKSFYSPAEAAKIDAATGPERYFLFYKYWTIKEACIKADGNSVMQIKDSADLSHLHADEMAVVTPLTLPGKSGFTSRIAEHIYLAAIWGSTPKPVGLTI